MDTFLQPFEGLAEYEEIRKRLERMMPGYCARAGEAGEEIRKLWKKETERQ